MAMNIVFSPDYKGQMRARRCGIAKPKPRGKDGECSQPIANLRRVNNMEFRASSVQHIILLVHTTDRVIVSRAPFVAPYLAEGRQ